MTITMLVVMGHPLWQEDGPGSYHLSCFHQLSLSSK